MKKLLFILLVVSMTASAFALDLSAELIGTFNLFRGNFSSDEKDLFMGGGERGRVRLQAQHEKDGFGGWFRLQGAFTVIDEDPDVKPVEVERLGNTSVNAYGHLWYGPNDKFSIHLSTNPDGHWALDGNALWGFYGVAGDVIVNDRNSYGSMDYLDYLEFDMSDPEALFDLVGIGFPFATAFYSGFSNGLFVTLNPTEAFTINIGVPLLDSRFLPVTEIDDTDPANPETITLRGQASAWTIIRNSALQLSFNLGDAGLIGLTYAGLGISDEDLTNYAWDYLSQFFLYYNVGFGNVVLDFGIGYTLFDQEKRGDVTYTEHFPISIGVAASVDISEQFNLKARAMFTGLGSSEAKGPGVSEKENDGITTITLDLLPSFKINEKITAYLNVGFSTLIMDTKETDPLYGEIEIKAQALWWHFNPYVTIGVNDNASFYAGFSVNGINLSMKDVPDEAFKPLNKYAPWSIPIGLRIVF